MILSFQRAFRDPQLKMDLEIVPNFFPRDISVRQLSVEPDQMACFRTILTEKFNSEPPQPGRKQRLDVLSAGLCAGVEHRITATHIRFDQMLRPNPVS